MSFSRHGAQSKRPALYNAGLLILTASLIWIFVGQTVLAKNRPISTLEFHLPNKHGTPDSIPKGSFDCLDKIYAVTYIRHLPQKKHSIEFRWINPQGQTQERTQYDFLADKSGETKLWAWLKLSRGKGAGIFQWLDPATGLEEFIGAWTVELLINGRQINSNNFEVSC